MSSPYDILISRQRQGRMVKVAIANGVVNAVGMIDPHDQQTWVDVIGDVAVQDPSVALADMVNLIRKAFNVGAGGADGPPGWTLADVLASDEVAKSVTWLPFLGQYGVIAEGWSHVIGGYTGAGKSPLMKHACIPWLRLEKRVLWVSEELRRVWKGDVETLRAIHGDNGVPWSFQRVIPATGRTPGELVKEASSCSFDVLILDTMRAVCQPESEKDAAEVRKALAPWLALATERFATVIVIHHHRKQEGEHGERFAGSEAILAPFDVAIEYRFGSRDDQRVLSGVRIRGGHPRPHYMVERRDDFGQLIIAGETGYVRSRELNAQAIETLEEMSRPVTTKELRAALGEHPPSLDTVERSLVRLARKGVIRRSPPISEHVTGKVVRWQAIDLFA